MFVYSCKSPFAKKKKERKKKKKKRNFLPKIFCKIKAIIFNYSLQIYMFNNFGTFDLLYVVVLRPEPKL